MSADLATVRRRNLDRDQHVGGFFHKVETLEFAQSEIAALLEESNDPLVLPERRCAVHAKIIRLRAIVKGGGAK